MITTNIYLTNQLAQMHVRALLADTERQHAASIARAVRARTRRRGNAVRRRGWPRSCGAGCWLIPPRESARNHRPAALGTDAIHVGGAASPTPSPHRLRGTRWR
jgi:hypothetical protein